MLNRRSVLRAATALPALALPHVARAAEKLVVIAHAVHRTAATTGKGGDITEEWRRANNVEIEWLTFGVEAVNERGLKEASLAQGNADIAFLLDRYTGPQFAPLFEDLGEWMGRVPLPEFGEIPQGMLAAHRFGGKQAAMPYRRARSTKRWPPSRS